MSLDVTLSGDPIEEPCPHCDGKGFRQADVDIFSANITHNLNDMAEEAGIYMHLWRPDEIGIQKAKELIEPLRAGIAAMKANPPRFERWNAPNGWGLYKNFVPWVERYLKACEENPDANVRVSR